MIGTSLLPRRPSRVLLLFLFFLFFALPSNVRNGRCVSRTFLYVQSIVFVLVKARAKKRVHELASYAVFFCWNAYLCSHLQVVER